MSEPVVFAKVPGAERCGAKTKDDQRPIKKKKLSMKISADQQLTVKPKNTN